MPKINPGEYKNVESVYDYGSITTEHKKLVEEIIKILKRKDNASTDDVIEELKSNPISSRFVFLKGSRGMKLESLIDFIK